MNYHNRINKRHLLAAFALTAVTTLPMTAVLLHSSAQFIDDSETEFNTGVYSDTQFDGVNNWVELDASGLVAEAGDYESAIFNAGGPSSWDTIAWVPESPTSKPLPNSDGVETVYDSDNVDMTGNTLLLHLDESAGPAIDNSGSGIDAINDGASFGATGIIGNAIDVTGNGDQVENDAMTMTLGAEVTLMAWYRRTGAGTGSPRILEISRLGNADSTALAVDTNGSLRAWSECSTGTRVGSADDATTYTDGGWHHFAYTYSGTIGRLYVDGVETDTGGGVCANLDDPTVLTLGAISDVSGQYTQSQHEFDGYIDEAAIFDRVLSPTEIENMYERGARKLRFQVRSCDDVGCVGETYIGPDGTAATYYEWFATTSLTTPSFSLTNVSDNQYFQYKAFFETEDNTLTPELESVSINYTTLNAPPNTPVNSSPADVASNINANSPLSASSYFDADTDPHGDTQWQVDDNSDFSSPVWTRTAGTPETSTAINSSNGAYQNELITNGTLLPTGVYHWRVRYQDDLGNWSDYSASTSFQVKDNSGGGGSDNENQFPPQDPSISILDNAACTTSTTVPLSFRALSAANVHISNESQFISGVFIPVDETVDGWELTPGIGEKTVYALFKTSSGVPSVVVSDTITLSDTCETDSEEPIEIPPEEVAACPFGCAQNAYRVYIQNPDGTRRVMHDNYSTVEVRANKSIVSFEDKGMDMDFNDVVLSLETGSCPNLTVSLDELNAGWDHQIGLEVMRNGIVLADILVFSSSQEAALHTSSHTVSLEDIAYACYDEGIPGEAKRYTDIFISSHQSKKSPQKSILERILPKFLQ